jgi:Holliday junction resolvase RusA-like endonuclease
MIQFILMKMNDMIVFEIDPSPAPRMVKSDVWRKRPVVLRYFVYRDNLRLLAKLHKYTLTETLSIVFFIPMPVSWSEKKKRDMNGGPHQSRPDIDNLCKAFLDCLEDEDSYVWRIEAEKRWAYVGSIQIQNPRSLSSDSGVH